MYISVNNNNEIKKVGVSTDPSLTSIYVDENVEMFPFKGWSEAKICCYKVTVNDGIITMMTPYVDSRLLDHFDQVGVDTEVNEENISVNSDGMFDLADVLCELSDAIYELAEYIAELDERVSALEEKE